MFLIQLIRLGLGEHLSLLAPEVLIVLADGRLRRLGARALVARLWEIGNEVAQALVGARTVLRGRGRIFNRVCIAEKQANKP